MMAAGEAPCNVSIRPKKREFSQGYWQGLPGMLDFPQGASLEKGGADVPDGYRTKAAFLLAIGVNDTPMFGTPLAPPNGGPVAPCPPCGLSPAP
jgi:hypothetical protein